MYWIFSEKPLPSFRFLIYKEVLIIICRYPHLKRRFAVRKHCTHDTFKGKGDAALCDGITPGKGSLQKGPGAFLFCRKKRATSRDETSSTSDPLGDHFKQRRILGRRGSLCAQRTDVMRRGRVRSVWTRSSGFGGTFIGIEGRVRKEQEMRRSTGSTESLLQAR